MNLDETLDIDAILQRKGRRVLVRGCIRLFLVPLLNFYLAHDTYPFLYWLNIALAWISVGRGLVIFANYFLDRWKPEMRSAFLWPEIGEPAEVRKAIEDDWNLAPVVDKYRQEVSYLTPGWLLRWSDSAWSDKVAFQATPLRYAVLAYAYHQPDTKKAMVAIHWSGKTSATTIEVPTLEAGVALLVQIQKRAPWAYFGLSEENYLGWTTNHEVVVEAAHRRYGQVQAGEAVTLSTLTPDDTVECQELPLKPLQATETMIPERMDMAAILRNTSIAGFVAAGLYLIVFPLGCWIIGRWLGQWLPFIIFLAIIGAAISMIFGAMGVWAETLDWLHPEQRSEFQFPSLGDATQVSRAIETEWNESAARDKLRFGDFYLTPTWLMQWNVATFRPMPLRYVAWAYASEKAGEGKKPAQPTLVIHTSNGRTELTIPLNARVDAVEFLAALRQRAPWVYIGDTPANRRRWSEERELFLQTVDSRRELAQTETGHVLPAEWDEDMGGWIEDE